MFVLNGKVAVLTGISSDLGRQAPVALAEQGTDVAILDIIVDNLKEARKEVLAIDKRCIAIICDVTKEDTVRRLLKLLKNNWERLIS